MVIRDQLPDLKEEENKPYGIVDEDDFSNPAFYESPGGPYSPCESPVKTTNNGRFIAEKISDSPVISPGKIKHEVTKFVHENFRNLAEKENIILENSPSKIPCQSGSFLDILNKKRNLRKQMKDQENQCLDIIPLKNSKTVISPSKSRSQPKTKVLEKSPETVIGRVMKSIEGGKKRTPFGEARVMIN